MNRSVRPPFTGPALFSYGFRSLFLLAGLWAVAVVPLWMAIWSGTVTLTGPFSPTDWHIHELLFGYTSVVIAGFLFTAIPNWTGRMPTRGWPLVALSVLWRGWRVWREPLLLMLHVAFAFVAAGLLGIGLAALGILPAATGLHLLGIGGIGGMTLAVMMRASLSHTGRPTEAGLALALAFGAVALAAVARAFYPETSGLWTAAAFWTFGFVLFLWHFAPILAWLNPARRKPNAAPSTVRT